MNFYSKWYFFKADGKALSSIATVNDNFLLIPTTSRDDRSTYLCSASNEYGTFEATGELEVTGEKTFLYLMKLLLHSYLHLKFVYHLCLENKKD